jgi:hypothetical protein
MSTLSFMRNYMQVIQGTQLCIDQKLLMPALILIYTLIDTLAWAASSDKKAPVRRRFEAWVTEWVGTRLPCSATELYAARCGILHTLTSKADLTTFGNVREVAYAWGTAKSEDLQATIDHMGKTKVVAVHVNELFQAVREAMADILEKGESDASLGACLNEAASFHLVNKGPELVAQYLRQVRNESGV